MVFCRLPWPWYVPRTTCAASCDPRLLPKVSLHRGASIVSTCEIPRHSINTMATFSCSPLRLTIALFIAVLSRVWRSCRSFFPRYAWRARESFDWTPGTIPTHTPRTSRLVRPRSFSLSGWFANGSSHCFRCSTPPPPRPPSHPLPAPFLFLLPLRSVNSLFFSLEGPLPLPGLPTNCPRIFYLTSHDFGGHGLQIFKER